jgi:hypothetical protein
VLHQPFLALRDSSRIPFTGRNLAFSSFHIAPRLTWFFTKSALSLETTQLILDNEDATRHLFTKDTSNYGNITFPQKPYELSQYSSSYGATWQGTPVPWLSFFAHGEYGSNDLKTKNLPTVIDTILELDTIPGMDTVFYDSVRSEKWNEIKGDFILKFNTLLNPSVHYLTEFVKEPVYQEREHGFARVEDTLSIVRFWGEGGLQRNSLAEDEVSYNPSYAGEVTVNPVGSVFVSGAAQSDTRFPDFTETFYTRTGRLAFANPELKPEHKNRYEAKATWNPGGIFYGLGYRYESAENLIAPAWAKQAKLADILLLREAYTWTNLDKIHNHIWFAQLGFRISNWWLFAERGVSFAASENPLVPSRYYKGTVLWKNRFVQDRLGVSVRFDAEWFGDRADYGIARDGEHAALVRLPHYLALNFEAKMQISSFELYTRIHNLNHSIYFPETGYAPPGVSFRYGIRWMLMD